jgi:hypothetical protein
VVYSESYTIIRRLVPCPSLRSGIIWWDFVLPAETGVKSLFLCICLYTTFGSIVYENNLKTMDKIVPNYWQIKSIDVLKSRDDFPPEQKEKIMNEYIETSGLKGIVNTTQLSSFNVVKKYDDLIIEVLKVMDNAEKEIYFATRYHDPHVSSKVFEKFSKGVTPIQTQDKYKLLV